MSNIASQVILVHRRDKLRAEAILADRINKKVEEKKIQILWDSVLEEICGDNEKVIAAKIFRVLSKLASIFA